VFVAAALCLGLVVGSFLNVVVHRVPRGESIVRPGSRCPACGHGIGPLENVPVLSWLFLRGRCRGCAAPISLRYPLVELITGLLFAVAAWRFGPGAQAGLVMLLAAGLLAAALIDFEHRFIPDAISLGGLAVGLVVAPLVAAGQGAPLGQAAGHALLGALLGGGLLWSVGFLHARVSVAVGRRFEHWPGEGEPQPRPSQADYWLWTRDDRHGLAAGPGAGRGAGCVLAPGGCAVRVRSGDRGGRAARGAGAASSADRPAHLAAGRDRR